MNTTDLHIPSNRVRDIERYILTELSGQYPEGELRSMTAMLFEAFLGWDRVQWLLHRDETINQSDLLRFHWAVEELKRYRPIQHICGYADFCGCRIRVTPDTLIPRPETEELVALALQHARPQHTDRPLRILDLCSGSGCIAIALERSLPGAQVWGVDISGAALAVARDNATANGAAVTFVQCDLLKEVPALPADTFDLILSNPPYVCDSERAAMQPNVLDYEPGLALFVPDDDPLRFYRAIGRYAARHLTPQGALLFEINETLGAETSSLLTRMGFHTDLHQDFRGRDRMLTCSTSLV